jgi:hypothetical protein
MWGIYMHRLFVAPINFLFLSLVIGLLTYAYDLVPVLGPHIRAYQKYGFALCWSMSAVFIGYICGLMQGLRDK